MERPYLISAEHHDHARHEVWERHIPPNRWTFVPWEPERFRHEKLAGLAGYDEEHLIGHFSDYEKWHLLRKF
jgi:hypothetical protein